ncbi:hypothetical protein D3C76_1199520 [compost metagenome]
MENTGELDGDIATAHHQHAAWQVLEEERLVGGDRQFLAGDVRYLGPATGGNEDVLGGVALTVDFHFIGTGHPRMALQQRHAAVDQQVAVDAVEALDFAVLVGNQRTPVEVPLFQGPAEACCLLKLIGHMGPVHQQLFRHAANVDASTTQVAALGHRHLRTKARSETRRTHTAGTGTNHEQIKIVGHVFSLLGWRPAYRRWPSQTKKPSPRSMPSVGVRGRCAAHRRQASSHRNAQL